MESSTSTIKIIFVLIDGIGELSLPQLDNQTLLQCLPLPYYHLIASTGLTGIMDPVETGLACGSDTAHMNILGYNPFTEYRGRGSFETLGSGIPMDFNEIGFKCNFAYMDPQTKLVHKRRVDREFDKWGLPLIECIDNMGIPGFPGYKCCCVHATEHRCAIKITGPGLSSKITSTDPLKDSLKLKEVISKNETPEGLLTAKIVNSLSNEIFNVLKENPLNKAREAKGLLPANIVLLRGCGSRLTVKSFKELHGLRGFMIAPTAIINGIGQSVYMDYIKVKGATGDYNSDYLAKANAMIDYIRKEQYDFGFLHIKAVDDAGHDKSFERKREFLLKVDVMLEKLIDSLKGIKTEQEEFIICLTGDHTTPLRSGDHTFEPVPFAITTLGAIMGREGVRDLRDNVERFDEVSAAAGCLGRFSGAETMGVIKKFRKVVGEVRI